MKKRRQTNRDYPRTARLNRLVQEIVAEELERIDDERLGLVTVVAVEVEADMHRAVVYVSLLEDGDDPADVLEALAEHRVRLQGAVGRQARTKRTPELRFEQDQVTRTALRVEGILRDLDLPDDD